MTPLTELQECAPGVWQVTLPWTRAYILSDGSNFSLVDTGTTWDRDRLMAACASLGLGMAQCQSVLLTHGHCDHSGNAAFFKEQAGTLLYAHEAERPFLETHRTYVPPGSKAWSVQGALFTLSEIVYPVRRVPVDRELVDGDVVKTPAGTWRVVHTPGHTAGHVCYFRENDRVLLSGDALLTVIPFIRRAGLAVPPAIFNTGTALARHSVKRLVPLAPRILLPGHGEPLCHETAARIAAFAASS